MKQQSAFARVVFTFALSTAVLALPAPVAFFISDPGGSPTGVVSVPNPPQASGSLRGSLDLGGFNAANVISTETTVIPPSEFQLAPGQSEKADLGLYLDFTNVKNPQPIRGGTTSPTDPGPRTLAYDRLNSDRFAIPGTDSGGVPNAKWPLGLSRNRPGLAGAGWGRQQSIDELPVAVAMAGVDMRLSPNAYRELHWHKANEWAYILNGTVRVQAMNDNGESFVDDLTDGDVWFFPAGVPHVVQAGPEGVEFLLVFDDGTFSEDGTFLVSEFMEHMPKSVLAKNLQTDVSTFKNLPKGQLWIFNGTPYPANITLTNITGAAGVVPLARTYSYHWSEQQPYTVPGGSVKIIDPINFPTASNFAAALVTVEPGAMREIHWHPTSDEWNYFIAGTARMTIFSAPASSQTFDFSAGDVGYIPVPQAHYIENTGNTTLMFLEVLQAPKFTDISLGQWLGLTPPQVVQDHLNLSNGAVHHLSKDKLLILPGTGKQDPLATNFTVPTKHTY